MKKIGIKTINYLRWLDKNNGSDKLPNQIPDSPLRANRLPTLIALGLVKYDSHNQKTIITDKGGVAAGLKLRDKSETVE